MAFTRRLSKVCRRWSRNPAPIRGPPAGTNCSSRCQRTHGAASTFTVVPGRNIPTVTTCIPQDLIGDRTPETTIGASNPGLFAPISKTLAKQCWDLASLTDRHSASAESLLAHEDGLFPPALEATA